MRKVCIAITTWAVLGTAGYAQPYDLRGIQLGISLSEFKMLPFPDGKDAKALCRGDPETKKKWGTIDLRVRGEGDDVLGCTSFKYGKFFGEQSASPAEWHRTSLNVATIPVVPMFVFAPDEKNVVRLYKIKITADVRYWSTFWQGYTGRYGQPSRLSKDPVQNKIGMTFDNVLAIWENPDSRILLEKRAEKIETTRITYIHTGLMKLMKARSRSKKGLPKDNL